MKAQLHIGIAEDHDLVRQGFVALLNRYAAISVLFDVGNGLQLLEALKTHKPGIILLDLDMPVLSGREAFDKIKQKYPRLKIIIISAFFQEAFIVEYVKKGVNAFLSKDSKIDKVVEALQAVHEQGFFFDDRVSVILAKEVASPTGNTGKVALPANDFTERELSIIQLICRHKTSKEIAGLLSLSKKTIDWHRTNIMRKTNAKKPVGAHHVCHSAKHGKYRLTPSLRELFQPEAILHRCKSN